MYIKNQTFPAERLNSGLKKNPIDQLPILKKKEDGSSFIFYSIGFFLKEKNHKKKKQEKKTYLS